ncbi:hypothetical protein THAOC_03388, partial [Thalassiosira oceanica]
MDQEEGVEVPHLARPPRRHGAGAEPARDPAKRGLLAAGILSRRSGNANAPARAADAAGGRDGVVAPQDGHVPPPPAGPPPSGRGGYYTRPPPRRRHLPSPSDAVQYLREFRHTPCLMAPAALAVLLAVALTSLVGLALALPRFVLGLLLGPLVRRSYWLVEFVYRHRLAGWGHVRLMEIAGRSAKKKGGGGSKKEGGKPSGHSATVDQRVEVVPGRVYVHPVPQFVDNLAYLVVCLPPPDTRHLPITAVLVDCGDHASALEHAGAVYRRHYEKEHPRDDGRGRGRDRAVRDALHAPAPRPHRGGEGDGPRADEGEGRGGIRRRNHRGLRRKRGRSRRGRRLRLQAGERCRGRRGHRGGAGVQPLFERWVLRAPPVRVVGGGERNDMNEVVSVEAVACPGHTRGSLVYALRDRPAPGRRRRRRGRREREEGEEVEEAVGEAGPARPACRVVAPVHGRRGLHRRVRRAVRGRPREDVRRLPEEPGALGGSTGGAGSVPAPGRCRPSGASPRSSSGPTVPGATGPPRPIRTAAERRPGAARSSTPGTSTRRTASSGSSTPER